ncbi:hypothetical protein MIDIC_240063 [Alphaproteobacteria bacterium]
MFRRKIVGMDWIFSAWDKLANWNGKAIVKDLGTTELSTK